MKPSAIYFSSLQFHTESKDLIDQAFQLIVFPTPAEIDQASRETAEVLFAPLGWFWGSSEFEQMPRLQVIASNTTGHPHIDVVSAQERGISVVTLKGQKSFLDSITPTAEHTIGLIIAITRNYLIAIASVEEGRWSRFPHAGEKMLSRSEVGIVGLGRLGKQVARFCVSLGMTVYAYDPYISEEIPDVVLLPSLEKLVANVDIVTVHVPHEPKTERMFEKRLFDRFRWGSFFVNTARGELVATDDLLNALEEGRLAGAALDVLEDEFNPEFNLKESPAWVYAQSKMNLILTPHIGGSTKDAWRDTQMFVIKKAIELCNQNESVNDY